MTPPQQPLEGKVLPAVGKAIPATSAFSALSTLIDEGLSYMRLREEERTKREQIAAYATVETARIRAAESVLKQYFEHVFAERAHLIDEMFKRLDGATERGDDVTMAGTLNAIVDLAKSSPLATVGDLGQLRQALDDPNHVWEF